MGVNLFAGCCKCRFLVDWVLYATWLTVCGVIRWLQIRFGIGLVYLRSLLWLAAVRFGVQKKWHRRMLLN